MPDSKLYTGRGDDGYTGLLGPGRVPKYDPRPETYGTMDEAQAALGLARALGCAPRHGEILLAVQRDCYGLMAELAAAGDADSPLAGTVTAAHVAQVEHWTAELEAQFELPREFVIPGDSQPGAALHLARTIVRRAERLVARLTHSGLLSNGQVLCYVNRLSALLFAMACLEDRLATGSRPNRARTARRARGQS